jgi:hypothetical protein
MTAIKAIKALHFVRRPGLPDGLFSTKNINLGILRRALDSRMLVHCMAIRNILRTFGKFCEHLVHFSRFGMFGPRKIWQPCRRRAYDEILGSC